MRDTAPPSRPGNWAVEIQHRGDRRRLSLGTPNKHAAVDRAKNLYMDVVTNGWAEAYAEVRPELAVKKSNATVGEFLAEVMATADVNRNTLIDYGRAFRKIVADLIGLDDNSSRFDHCSGGNQEWLAKVEDTKLAWLTPRRVQEWKKSFLVKAKPDPSVSDPPRCPSTATCAGLAVCSAPRLPNTSRFSSPTLCRSTVWLSSPASPSSTGPRSMWKG